MTHFLLEWVAVPFSRGSFQPSDRNQLCCIAGRFFTIWTTREALVSYIYTYNCFGFSFVFFFSSFVFSLVPLLQLCDFLSPKIYDFISIIYPWHSKYNTAKKNRSLDKPSFSKNWAKNKDLGRIEKLTSLAVLFIPAWWLIEFVVLWL